MAKKVKKPKRKLSRSMRKKLIVLFTLLTFCLCALIGRLMYTTFTVRLPVKRDGELND